MEIIQALREENTELKHNLNEQRQSLSSIKRILRTKEELILEMASLVEETEEEKELLRCGFDSLLEDVTRLLEEGEKRNKDANKELKAKVKLLKKMDELKDEAEIAAEERRVEDVCKEVELEAVRLEAMQKVLELEENVQELEAQLEDGKMREEEGQKQRRVDGEVKKAMEKLLTEKRTLITALSHSRAKETGLQEELDEAYRYLSNLSALQTSHNQLFEEYESFKSLTVSLHSENQLLKEENTLLVNHGNPAQKIQAMSRLREEMKSLREVNARLSAKLKREAKEKEQLVEELQAYGTVGSLNRPIIHVARHDVTLDRVLNDRSVNSNNPPTTGGMSSPTPSEKVWESMNLSPELDFGLGLSKLGAGVQSTPAKVPEAVRKSMIPRRRLETVAEATRESVLSDADMKAMEMSLEDEQRMVDGLDSTLVRGTGLMTLDEFY
ncbi:hypothetical protein BT69DRAFT_1300109 [Atractiella rhizophila]|nr:hypothetical protein BT69DRAFT_1300109 [Atractiella rhizophila]